MADGNTPIRLCLSDIAQWSNNSYVCIPALQRGLVWKPKQIELLWDSLMRGIPIGSFVVCKRIEKQVRSETDNSKYHLLDGQQRANAIQLGFDDFNCPQNHKGSILWIDITPREFPKESSRNFLFRVTTPAHPWGYTKNDGDGYLGAWTIRNWFETHLNIKTNDESYVRPLPKDIQPIEAITPVPFSLLLKAYSQELHAIDKILLTTLISNCHGTWVKNALEKLNIESVDLLGISHGIATALETTILALQAPDELLNSSQQENSNSDGKDITNIEHLFQRLNQQGTKLDGEELVYSMIKAYWPELALPIDQISENRMPASRLVSLAFRVTLTEQINKREKLALAQSVSSIRRLAKDAEKEPLRAAIIKFINSQDDDSLASCCKKIDYFLGTVPQKDWGLPPVLRSSIAYNNQDLYLLLLLLAKNNSMELSDDCCRLLTGVITCAAWFGNDQTQIANTLYQSTIRGINNESIVQGFKAATKYFCQIHRPENIAPFVVLPNASNNSLEEWNWWQLITDVNESEQQKKQRLWWDYLCVIKSSKDLLLYAQRDFISHRFAGYDPARKDLWEAHNRPWDYDHILPYAYTFNKKSNNRYMSFCNQWCNTIGNLRAWPFEDNRSDQATKAGIKLNNSLMRKSFINPGELPGFDQERNILETAESALKFAESCKNRIIRIYSEWFTQLKIAMFLDVN